MEVLKDARFNLIETDKRFRVYISDIEKKINLS